MIQQKYYKNIKLLIDGENSFKKIIDRIKNTKKSIEINMFIWRDDKIGNIVAEELLKAADKGVKISISKDKLGSVFEKSEENKQSFLHKQFSFNLWIKQKLVDLFYYTQGEAKDTKQKENELINLLMNNKNINISNQRIKGDHSKYYIFDNKYLITGGMNIEDRTVYTDVSGQKWNDYMVDINGKLFIDNLKANLRGEKNNKDSWFKFVLNSKEPINNFEIKAKMLDLLNSAKKKVHIQMAYFGDKDITNKIIEVANHGIDVTIILPKCPNLQKNYNYKIMKEIIIKTNNKAKVFLCNNMLHAKMIDIDEEKILLGSANMNRQTMKQLSELDILVTGDFPFTNAVRNSIKKHQKNSIKVENLEQIKFSPAKAFMEGLFC